MMKNKENERKIKFDKECKWLFKKPIYHRGKFDNETVYENTMEAFRLAINDKTPFEFDVQLTGDYKAVCFHDDNLKRLFNRDRLVSDISYKRINKLRDDLTVPLLKDVLNMVDGKVEIMIELKNTNKKFNKILVKQVYDLLKDYKGKYVIVSFNPSLLRQYKKLDKEVFMGRIGSANHKGFIHKLVINKHLFKFLVKPDFISYDVDYLNHKLLDKYKKRGYKITGWTLKDTNKIKDLKVYYDNFIIEGIESKDI